MLGDGIWFDNHTNALTESQAELDANHPPILRRPRPDQFCIHRVDGSTNSLLLTVEYKPPQKLSVETLRAGLRPMELWEEMVKCNTVPTDPAEKLKYNAERLVDSAMVQAYDVMIEEGRADAILTNGLARVLLRPRCSITFVNLTPRSTKQIFRIYGNRKLPSLGCCAIAYEVFVLPRVTKSGGILLDRSFMSGKPASTMLAL